MSAWDGEFTLNCMSNIAFAREEADELGALVLGVDDAHREQYSALPSFAQMAISVAWWKARKSLELHQECLASFCEPWFDGSAFTNTAESRKA